MVGPAFIMADIFILDPYYVIGRAPSLVQLMTRSTNIWLVGISH
jgi:hypothetical protein